MIHEKKNKFAECWESVEFSVLVYADVTLMDSDTQPLLTSNRLHCYVLNWLTVSSPQKAEHE